MTQPSAILSTKLSSWRDYFELGKPRITLFVCICAAAGFYLASTNGVQWSRFAVAIVCVGLVSFGSSAMNQCMEKTLDEKMNRTKARPLPGGRIPMEHAWALAGLTSVLGMAGMYVWVNPTAAFWLLSAWVGYVVLYTPLKQKSTINTLVGAVPGALPPIVGWAAARAHVSFEAWILFMIMFFWQLPHFLSIAWLFHKDYAQADFKMITSVDPKGGMTARQAFIYALGLVPLMILPTVFRIAGYYYLAGSMILTCMFLWATYRFLHQRTDQRAKQVLLASVIFLPAVFILMVIDKVGA
jgi:protoheme IX farnesyltransferase